MSPDKLESLKRKIQALRAKTVTSGCTEDEALAAVERARAIMDDYGLTEDDLSDVKSSEFKQAEHTVTDFVSARLDVVAIAIAALTETRTWCDTLDLSVKTFTFFGFSFDVDVATYLMEVCERAVRTALDSFSHDIALLRPSVRRSRQVAFVEGMTRRLSTRIKEITWARVKAKTAGQSLVVMKHQIIAAELDALGAVFTGRSGRADGRALEKSFRDGQLAGDHVSLNAGLNGQGAASGSIEA